jgi:hypothetical protein
VFEPSSLVRFEHPFEWTGTVHSSPAPRDDVRRFAQALVKNSRVSYLPPPAASSADA